MRYDREQLEERASEEVSLAKDAQRAGDERWTERHLDSAASFLSRAKRA